MNTFVIGWIVLLAGFSASVFSAAALPAAPTDRGYRLQETDPEALPLRPVKPRSETTQRQLEALSWFMTGRTHEIRNESKKAFEAYKQAIELDPQAADVYRAIVPLAFRLDLTDDAVQYATKAVELLPEDSELLRQLGIYLASQRKLPEAIRYLKQAADSPQMDRHSTTYVLLQRELGILHQAVGQPKPAAEAYAIVFDALQNPEKYGLDLKTKSALLAHQQTNYEKIGQVLLDGEQLDLARKAFELAAKSGRSSAGNLAYFQAKVLLLSNKPEEALTELQKYLDAQRQSKGRDAYLLLGAILEKLQRGDELIGRLEQLAEKDPRNNILQYFLAERLVAAGDLEKARAIYEAALEGTGDSAGYLGLAIVLRKLNRPDELLDALGRALAKAGNETVENIEAELKAITDDEELLKTLLSAGRAQHQAEPPQLTYEESFLLGKLAGERSLTDDAAEFYRIALKLATEMQQKFVLYTELGKLLSEAKRYADAAAAYGEAINERSLGDQKPHFLNLMAWAKELGGDTDGALATIEDAKNLLPGNPILQFQEGRINYHSRRFDQAIKVFEKIVTEFPNQKEIVRSCQFSLSNIHVQRGEMRKGEEILERILAEEPDDPAVNNDLGYLYADQGKNLEQAETMIRKAVAADPDNSAYQDSLGWVLFKLGRFEEAREPLEKAVKLSTGPGDTTLWDHLGDLYHRLNELDKAVEAWEKAWTHAQTDASVDAALKERLQDKLKQFKK